MKSLLTLCVAVLLVGCGDGITPHNYEQAVKVCEPNGGLDYVSKYVHSYYPEAVCKSGIKITKLPMEPRK